MYVPAYLHGYCYQFQHCRRRALMMVAAEMQTELA